MTFPTPHPNEIWGPDTSVAQGLLRVHELVAVGAGFLIAKATDGRSSIDRQWFASSRAAVDEGLPLAGYGVLEPGVDPEAQAEHFAAVLVDSGAAWGAVDFELAHGETGVVALEAASTFAKKTEDRTGKRCLVYTGPSFIETLERFAGAAGDAALAELVKHRLWLSHYGVLIPHTPPPWRDDDGDGWTLWQRSGGRAVSKDAAQLPWDHRVDVDVNIFRGSAAEFIALGCPA